MSKLIIAEQGGDITDDVEDLALTSGENYLIFLEERTDTSNGSGILEFTHGLGYKPAFYSFEEISSGVWEPPYLNSYATDTIIHIETIDPSTQVRTILFANSQDNSVGTANSNASGKLKIAKSGYDAGNAVDLRELKFASAGGTFKIKESKTITVSVTSANGTFTTSYAHGLGYVPQVYALLYDTVGVSLPYFDNVGAGVAAFFSYSVDSTNITCSVFNSDGAVTSPSTVTFKVHILYDKIN